MRILLAEDDDLVRELLIVVLESAGHAVSAVADGEAAWAAFQVERPDIAVFDWMMPRLDGLEVVRRMRASDPLCDTFIVVVTARGSGEDLAQVLDAGADDYISKPLSPETVLARLTIAVRRVEMEQRRRAAEAALARAERMAAIGETAVAVQHEINNPLAALVSAAEILRALPPNAMDQEQFLAIVLEQADRIAAVVRRLADIRDPRTVEYLPGTMMLDLRDEKAEY